MVYDIKLATILVKKSIPPSINHQVLVCVMYYFILSICFESLCTFFKTFPMTFICHFSSPCSSTLNNTLLTIYIYYQNVQGEPPRMVYQCHDCDHTYPCSPYPNLPTPFPSHQNHPQAPNATPKPSGSILSQLMS